MNSISKPGVVARRGNAALWWCTVTCLGLCAVALICFPLLRITTPVSLNYNEGWNAYRDQMAAVGTPLYASPPDSSITNYPFLSYHVVGLLSRVVGDVTLTGRAVAFASLLATAALVAAIVRRLTGSWRASIFAGLCYFVWIGTYSPDRRAMNDPHLLGMAFTTFGLYAYVHAPRRLGWLAISAIAFATGVFTKNNLIAFPIATALDLLLRRQWRTFAVWATIGIVAGITLLCLTFWLDSRYFFHHLLLARPYDVTGGVAANLDFATWFYAPLAIALGWLYWGGQSTNRLTSAVLLLVTAAIETVFAFGSGVDSNIFYDVIAALALVTTLALWSLEQAVPQERWAQAVLGTLVVLPALAGAMHVPRQVHSDVKIWRELPSREADTAKAIEMLDHVSGPVLCENILLCFEAHKPMGLDANFIQAQTRLGRVPEDVLLSQIDTGYYGAVEIGEEASRAPITPGSPQLRFSPAFMAALFNRYRPMLETAHFSIFLPR